MESLANRAVSDPEGVALLMEEEYALTIGDVLVALRHLGSETIGPIGLDARSKTALSRMRCETWADLATRTVGDIWSVPSAGRLTVTRILAVAARRNAEEALDSGTVGATDDDSGNEGTTPQRGGVARLDRVVRELATWAIRERGAARLSDLISLSTDLGRIPSEISAEFARLNDFPLDTFVGESGSQLSADLLTELLEAVGPRVDVLVARKVRLGPRPTLEDLGRELGVTRERVRQVESKALTAAQEALASDRFGPLRWRASDLRDVIGVAVLEDSELLDDALGWAVRGLASPEICDAGELMLWLAGPYERDEGWLIQSSRSLPELRREFEARISGHVLIDEGEAREVLEDLGLPGQMSTDFVMRAPGWRALDAGWFVRWSGALGDKADIVLKLVGRPCSVEEVNAHIGEGHAASSLRNVLAADSRFIRLDKASNFGLAEWGLEEYSGIAQEIIERVERGGGSADLEDLVSELVEQFGVSASSVRMYAGSPAFVVNNGRVLRRSPDEPYVPDERIERVRGLYAAPDGQVIVHDIVDKDVLRGSGRQMPEAAAALMGIRPGGRVDFDFSGDSRIVVSWPATSVMGPSLGSVRSVATKLGLGAGDAFRLIFDPTTMTCSAEVVDAETIEGLTGLSVAPGRELSALASALRVEPQAVRSRLQARGDDAVLSLLPAVETSADLGDAISRFGDLLSG